ncbi:hypothetical protein GCM10009564_23790 [Streptomyces thermogriseus]|uniref:Uncharacterized protein n=1 Tax=Streptomyces thermogriseus TaxID=75292 RepID=A0ABN1SYZ1_9ACTN
MSDRPSRRSPPASSRSIAAARSSDWMFRAIAVLPPSLRPSADDSRAARSAMPNTTGPCRLTANGWPMPVARPAPQDDPPAILVRLVDARFAGVRSRLG